MNYCFVIIYLQALFACFYFKHSQIEIDDNQNVQNAQQIDSKFLDSQKFIYLNPYISVDSQTNLWFKMSTLDQEEEEQQIKVFKNQFNVDYKNEDNIIQIEGKQFQQYPKLDINSFIISFNLKEIDTFNIQTRAVILDFGGQIIFEIQNQSSLQYLSFIYNYQKYTLQQNNLNELLISLQFQFKSSPKNYWEINIYQNDSLYKNFKIDIENSTLKNQLLYQKISINQQFIQEYIFLINHEIQQPDSSNSSHCLLYLQKLFNQKKILCFIKPKLLQKSSFNQQQKVERKLASFAYIYGERMRTLVRFKYTNSEYQTNVGIVGSSNLNIRWFGFVYIGYFKLSQNIIGTKYLPLITIRDVKQQYYTVLNMYIVNDTTVEVVHYHDKSNKITKITQTVPNLQNTWLALGFGIYSPRIRLIYQAIPGSPQLSATAELNSANFPDSDSISDYWNICITCKIEGGNFDHFEGSVSTVKLIQGVYIEYLNQFSYFNELDISKSSILSLSFDFTQYKRESEYDFGQGFVCQPGYRFVEGVCILACQEVFPEFDPHSDFESGRIYFDSPINKCVLCTFNCKVCDQVNCIQCRVGYELDTGKCIRKIDTPNPTSALDYDHMNQLTPSPLEYNQYSHKLNPTLLSNRVFLDNKEVSIAPSLTTNKQIILCYIDVDNNPVTLYSFVGGVYFTKISRVWRSWNKVPIGYKKKVQFYALFYGSGTPQNLIVTINQQVAQLNSTYETIQLNKVSCSGSDTLKQSIYKVEFYTNDYQTNFQLQIQSTVDQWAIRNINIEVFKCHPTCGSCLKGGGPQDCTSCGGNLILQNFQCVCKDYKYYPRYMKNIFQSPSYECKNCNTIGSCDKCETLNEKCIKCVTPYIVRDGKCIDPNTCVDSDEKFSNFCGARKDDGLLHFAYPRIIQYGVYWKLYNNNISYYECFSKQFAPIIGNGNMHTLQMNLPNYQSYHFRLNITFEIAAIDSIKLNDKIEIYDDNKQIFSQSYATKLIPPYPPGASQSCGIGIKYDYTQKESIEYAKDNNEIFLKFKSVTDEPISNESHSFTNLKILYVRCHPLCKQCNGPQENNCISCIQNSSVQSGKCQCNEGYFLIVYKTPDDNGFPGKCEKCDLSCKTCEGSTYQDCTSCSDGYAIQPNGYCLYTCKTNEYWDQDEYKCQPCHGCCLTCNSGDANNCHDCGTGKYMSKTDNSCYFTSLKAKCEVCSLIQNSYCGGTKNINSDCVTNGWIQMDSNICVYCGDFINDNCAGDQDQSVIDFCIQKGFEYDGQKCSSCSKTYNDTQCGQNQVKDVCKANGWIVFNINKCINCSKDSPTLKQCICFNTCQTCSVYFSYNSCNTCISTHTLFEGQCLPKCPNGLKSVSQKCELCLDEEMPTCFSCFKTCQICEPFTVSNISNSCTQCSGLTRYLFEKQCKCKDAEDVRENFFECSYDDKAVLDVIISKDKPKLSINFGKSLITPIQFQGEPYNKGGSYEEICKFLFAIKTLSILGDKAKCKISKQFINVDFDKDALIIEGDFIYFNPNILQFEYPSLPDKVVKYIVKYYNNVVTQEKLVGVPQVIYDYISEQNSCNEVTITFVNFINTGDRGFHEIKWKVTNFPQNSPQELGLLNDILQIANDAKKQSIVVPKDIIKPDMDVTIQLNYHLKVNYKSEIQFPIKLKLEKQIIIDFQTPIKLPFYRFQSGIISINSFLKLCLPSGEVTSVEPLIFQISCAEHPDLNYQNQNYQKAEYLIEFKQFTFPSLKLTINKILNIYIHNQIQVKAQLISDTSISTQKAYTLPVSQTPLLVKIIGSGKNGYFHYLGKVEINCQVRDYDLQNENDPQDINITWSCTDPVLKTPCVDKDKKIIDFGNYKFKAIIQPDTFQPYTIVQLVVIGTKPINRESSDKISLIFTELDLPPLAVEMKTSSFDQKTINLNEEIYVTLAYSSSVNIDTLSFSGTIIYQSNVVGVIKFDYTQLRIQLWNYYTGFKREQSQFQLRFSVFNPSYYMPSTQLLTLNINFPPKNCKFTVAQSSSIGYSVETKFLLQMQNCEDEDTPIQYQFFFYNSEIDFEFEKKYPLQVKRCQITDKSKDNNVNTILPPGQILLLAQAIDSKQGIYNSTISLKVQKKILDENTYVNNLQSLTDSILQSPISKQMADLSIISYDILQRNELNKSAKLNSKKIEIINNLKEKQNNLSTFSSFATNINKAITSLTESGITFSPTQSTQVINDIFTSLDKNYEDKSLDAELSKEKLKQNLYDSFQIFDSLSNSKSDSSQTLNNKEGQQKLVDLQEKIGTYLFKNLLPNEDPVMFKGKSSSITSTKITNKYICSFFMCENFQDGVYTSPPNDETATNIYNVKFLSSSDNPYKFDDSFQNYTNSLKKADSNLKISTYPVITPDIKNDKNQQLSTFENKVSIKFTGQTKTDKTSMACLSKNSKLQWTKENCQNIYNKKSNTYTCMCQSLSPTTILEDLSDLLTNNNLVNTALTEDGFKNISKFTEFYKYVVFWLLCFQTTSFILLFLKGRALDALDKQNKTQSFKIFNSGESPINSTIKRKGKRKIIKSNQVIPINFPHQYDHENKLLKIESSSKKEIKLDNETNSRQQLHTKHQSVQFAEEKQQNDLILTNLDIQDEEKQDKNKNIQFTPPQILSQHNSDSPNQTEDDYKEQYSSKVLKKSKLGIHSTLEKSETIQSRQNIPSSTSIFKDFNQRQDQQNPYLKLSYFKQAILFHNFFGIFYIYNSNVARSLRFLIFYVRAIHSIAISVIFDSKYSIIQRAAIAVISAVSIIIVVKVLEKLFSCKVGKIIGPIIILGVLGSYYYVILAIVSGQSPGDSNSSLIYFSILFFGDILLFSSISAIFQRQICIFIFKSENLSGFLSFFYKAIELQLVLNSLE